MIIIFPHSPAQSCSEPVAWWIIFLEFRLTTSCCRRGATRTAGHGPGGLPPAVGGPCRCGTCCSPSSTRSVGLGRPWQQMAYLHRHHVLPVLELGHRSPSMCAEVPPRRTGREADGPVAWSRRPPRALTAPETSQPAVSLHAPGYGRVQREGRTGIEPATTCLEDRSSTS